MVCEACKQPILTDANGAPLETYVSVEDEARFRWYLRAQSGRISAGPMEGRELYYHARCYRPAKVDKLWGQTLDAMRFSRLGK